MAVLAEVGYSVTVTGPSGPEVVQNPPRVRFAPGVGDHIDWHKYAVAADTYQAFTVPSGSKLMLLILGNNVSTVLKGDTLDTGIPIAPSDSPLGVDLIVPLGADPTPGVHNEHTESQNYYVAFL